MKSLFTIVLIILCLNAKSQSVKVQLKENGYYITDTLKIIKQYPENPNQEFVIGYIMVLDGYFISSYKGNTIYIGYDQIQRTPEFLRFDKKLTKFLTENILNQMDEKYKDLIAMFGKRYAYAIVTKNILIGMTKAMVLKALGQPENITNSQTDYTSLDMWVYKYDDSRNKYIFFTDGLVSGLDYPVK